MVELFQGGCRRFRELDRVPFFWRAEGFWPSLLPLCVIFACKTETEVLCSAERTLFYSKSFVIHRVKDSGRADKRQMVKLDSEVKDARLCNHMQELFGVTRWQDSRPNLFLFCKSKHNIFYKCLSSETWISLMGRSVRVSPQRVEVRGAWRTR